MMSAPAAPDASDATAEITVDPERSLEPRCVQCGEPLVVERWIAPRTTGRTLCADCACDGIPHTD
jgi:hypothetical protein